jgi:hypothetical protein
MSLGGKEPLQDLSDEALAQVKLAQLSQSHQRTTAKGILAFHELMSKWLKPLLKKALRDFRRDFINFIKSERVIPVLKGANMFSFQHLTSWLTTS